MPPDSIANPANRGVGGLYRRYILKKIIYAVGLISLPIIYIVLMLITEQKIEYSVLGLMLLIISPILIFGNKIGKIENKFNSMSNEEKVDIGKEVVKKILKNTRIDN
jgi:hypothetical protein